jgi:imidazolonepropionase-like amidohydrolase
MRPIAAFSSLFLALRVEACAHGSKSATELATLAKRNNEARAVPEADDSSKIVLDNVRVFDGNTVGPLSTVVIDGDVISFDSADATDRFDAQGAVLLPGLIDAHVHPETIEHLKSLTGYGVTTAFHAACTSREHCLSVQGHVGLVDIHLAATSPAAAPNSMHGNFILAQAGDASLLVDGLDDAQRWFGEQLATDPGFFKLIAQSPGLSQETLNFLVDQSHRHGKRVICHAVDVGSHRQAMLAGADQIHHMPLDVGIDQDLAVQVLERGNVVAPTLTMMKSFYDIGVGNYSAAAASVGAYRDAGVPLIAGTDANVGVTNVPFGSSLHDELALLVGAGLSNVEALRAATVLAARYWGLCDRGVIAAGKRADLLLVDGDPTADIAATRRIKKVWVAGREYTGPFGGRG